jgi:hypothetical protein
MMALAAALAGPPPEPSDRLAERTDAAPVHRHAVLADVAQHDRAQLGTYHRNGLGGSCQVSGASRDRYFLVQYHSPSPRRPPFSLTRLDSMPTAFMARLSVPSEGPALAASSLTVVLRTALKDSLPLVITASR